MANFDGFGNLGSFHLNRIIEFLNTVGIIREDKKYPSKAGYFTQSRS